jgi:hypothetical protein
MRIELVGGPMDGQFVEVEFAPYEWRIAGKPADFYRNMLATPNSVPTHIKTLRRHLQAAWRSRHSLRLAGLVVTNPGITVERKEPLDE